jgi:ATP-dependent Lhr-like helicase
LLRGRLEVVGPVAADALARGLGLAPSAVAIALAALEGEGFVIQGRFTSAAHAGGSLEWCERRLLARIHRLTLAGARRRVEAVSAETYWRFLSEHQRALPGARRDGRLGLHEAVGQLQGFEMAASAWESDVLPGRVEKYQPEWLDTLSFSGELTWGRLRPPKRAEDAARSSLTRVAPIALAFRDDVAWMLPPERLDTAAALAAASPDARRIHAALKEQGALFFEDMAEVAGLLPAQVKDALGELAALGAVTSDGFAALRSLALSKPAPARRRSRWGASRPRAYGGRGGRWTVFPGRVAPAAPNERLERWAEQLLRRYGVVFRDLLEREAAAPSWWELVPTLRRLEARGETRGGRFVAGVAGEQYALPEAVEALRRARADDDWLVVSASDPLNLEGLINDRPRVPALRGNRLLYRSGRAVAVLQAGEISFREGLPEPLQPKAARALQLQVPSLREGVLAELKQAASASARG